MKLLCISLLKLFYSLFNELTMKKIFTLVAAVFVAFAMNAQVKSTVMELRPTTFVEETADQSWVFQNGISVKVNGKSYASVDAYTDGTETAPYAMLKVSKDKAGTITIPSNLGVVKVAFYGISNSSALNWAYLQSFANTTEFPIMTAEARDVMDNEAIKKLQYPISPMVSSLAQPFATFTAEKGTAWFEELNFEFDGNNQVAINIVLWTVSETEVEAWDPTSDKTITSIEEVVVPVTPVIYNLQGQVVGEDYQGIIIIDGKKYLNK